jgi:ketosteroid isomerase-like protein
MDDARELERLEREWVDALRAGDSATLERIWDEEFVFTDPGGHTLSREECLRDLASGALSLEEASLRSLRVQVFGDTGVVLGYVTLVGKAGRTRYDGDYDFMDVYAKRDGRWRAVLSSGGRASQLFS